MKILSHRGYWQSPAEKNTAAAFARHLDAGRRVCIVSPEGATDLATHPALMLCPDQPEHARRHFSLS